MHTRLKESSSMATDNDARSRSRNDRSVKRRGEDDGIGGRSLRFAELGQLLVNKATPEETTTKLRM